jgi:hypothetical protein
MVASVVQFLIDFFELNGVVKPPENAAEVPLLSVGGIEKDVATSCFIHSIPKSLLLFFVIAHARPRGKKCSLKNKCFFFWTRKWAWRFLAAGYGSVKGWKL